MYYSYTYCLKINLNAVSVKFFLAVPLLKIFELQFWNNSNYILATDIPMWIF